MADRSVWIDTDMGFDDLAAVTMVVAADIRVAGMSLVAGNTPLPQVERNACAAAEVFGWKFPILAGADAPLSGGLVTADYVLGADGMPGQGRKLPAPSRGVDRGNFLMALAEYLDGGGHDVLALGPLTNLARLVELRPDLAKTMRLIWMGGSAGAGNHTASAEFNAAVDPEALNVLIEAGTTVNMVDLQACRQVTVGLEDVALVSGLLSDLLEGYVRIADNGARAMALYDPVAAAALIDAEAVGFTPARLDVELDGSLTRGMTVIEWRTRKAAPNALVATSINPTRVRELFFAGLRHAGKICHD